MRESSYSLSTQNSQQPKDIRGGEKKVMKKSLSAILSLAMAFSMFSSVALGAEAAKDSSSFSDLKDLDEATRAKFDALISAGIFDGVSEGVFGLNDKMNRAQFAKVAALIFKLDVDTSLTTSSFSDVKADDPANGYALPYIEALKAAGLTDGYAPGQYNPAGEVTKQELAAFLLRGLGLDAQAKATPGVSDHTVSDWAKGYVALAIERQILTSGPDGTFGGTSAATRDLLVLASYAAQEQFKNLNKPEKASIASAKAIGVQKVEVKLDRDVDTEKATLKLTRGSADVPVTVEWAEDKQSAVLTLTDSKVRAGEYTVTLGGLDAAAVDKTVAKFTAEDEQLKSIDFLTTSDTIAYSSSVVIKLAAKNQYGENASFSGGSYTVYTSLATYKKISRQDDGTLALTLDTRSNTQAQQGVSVIPVTIVNNDQHITVSKNFKLGTQPILQKLELGEATYSNKEAKAITGKGDYATFDLNLYDQYGSNIAYDSPDFKENEVNVIWNDYVGQNKSGGTIVDKDIEDNGSNVPRLKISLNDNIDKSGDYTFTVTTQAATATGKVSIKSAKVATKVEIGDSNDVIAAGDYDVYIPIIAYDEQGNQLSVDDLTDDTNRERIKFNISGVENSGNVKIEETGAHKGSIRLKNINGTSKGSVTVTAYIATANAQSTATKTYTISDVRTPDRIREVTPVAKAIIPNAYSSFKYVIQDQYGKQMDYNLGTDKNKNVGTTVNYSVYVALEAPAGENFFYITKDDDSQSNQDGTKPENVLVDATKSFTFGNKDEWANNSFKQLNEGLRIWAKPGAEGKQATLKIQIVKNEDGKDVVLTTTTKQIQGTKVNEDLTYSLISLGDIYNTKDSKLAESVTGTVYKENVGDPSKSPLKKRINLTVTNAAGDKVAIPDDFIKNVTSSNPNSAVVGKNAAGKWYVLGYKTGTSTITVNYTNLKGESKTVSATVTTKNDPVSIESVVANNKKVKVAASASGKVKVVDEFTANPKGGLGDFEIVDNYGVKVDGLNLINYKNIYGVIFTAQNISLVDSNITDANANKVEIGEDGTVTFGSNVAQFDLVLTAPSGKSASTEVQIDRSGS